METKPITRWKEAFLMFWKKRWKWIVFALGCIVFLYLVYFLFAFRSEPIYEGVDTAYWDARMILFRVFCGVIDIAVVAYGMFLYSRKKLTIRSACIFLAFLAMITTMCYSFSTPIADFNRHFNQHDDYYGDVRTEFTREDGLHDSGAGHFGLIMTIFRTGMIPGLRPLGDGTYDFSFLQLGERYHPKTFYLLTGYFMRWNSLFLHGAPGDVQFTYGGFAYSMTNTEWALFEANRILWTATSWLSFYYIYKALRLLRFEGRPLVIAFAVAIFCPIFCFFANWDNNDAMYAMFGFAAMYRGLHFVRFKDWKSCALCAMDIGLSMSCKLTGAITGLVMIPLLLYAFIENVRASKGMKISVHTPWVRNLLQGLLFASIVFPIGFFWPLYNKIHFGQDIFYFSDANNPNQLMKMNLWVACFVWPNAETFSSIFCNHLVFPDWHMVQDYSLTSNFMKKALFNEYQFGHSYAQLGFLYVVGLLLGIYVLAMILIRFIRFLVERPKGVDWRSVLAIASILIMNWGWEVWFIFKSPHTCNCDIRYIPCILLGFGALAGGHAQSNDSICNPRLRKVVRYCETALVGAFVFGVVLAYTTITPWYAPVRV